MKPLGGALAVSTAGAGIGSTVTQDEETPTGTPEGGTRFSIVQDGQCLPLVPISGNETDSFVGTVSETDTGTETKAE
ncbi:hypothetical protein BRC83_06885 [Halobacteriales archaeon QS_1_68_17]|nr:MAG: hypothetical protein BRC83_06885 [Halobacteriales archaeon QS_1_68_17]